MFVVFAPARLCLLVLCGVLQAKKHKRRNFPRHFVHVVKDFSENGSFVVKKEHRIVSGGALVPGAREPSPQRRLLPATKAEIQARVC